MKPKTARLITKVVAFAFWLFVGLVALAMAVDLWRMGAAAFLVIGGAALFVAAVWYGTDAWLWLVRRAEEDE